MQSTTNLDRTAATLSIACIAHCIALPAIAISLPALAYAAEAEWIHWLLTALAVLASSVVLISAPSARTPSFVLPAALGNVLIISGLFAESFGYSETIPTVIGGLFLAAAHIGRLYRRK